jgi:hypothetical protein
MAKRKAQVELLKKRGVLLRLPEINLGEVGEVVLPMAVPISAATTRV